MIDASNDYKKEGKFNKWNKNKTINHYKQRIIEENFSRYVSLDQLKEITFSLALNRNIVKNEIKEIIDIETIENEIEIIFRELNKSFKGEY